MVIGFLTTEYPTEAFFAGGLASYLRRVAISLVAAGHEVEVFVTGDSDDCYQHDGVQVTRVRPITHWRRRIAGRSFVWQFSKATLIYDTARSLERSVLARAARRRFDVIQAPDFMAPGLAFALHQRLPLVTRLSHYGPLWQAAYRFPPSAELRQQNVCERHQMRASRAVYSPSRFLAERVAAEEGIDVSVVRPPFDVNAVGAHRHREPGFGLTRDGYALFFGTIGLMKGADRIVKVLPDVLRSCPDMRFVFAGNARASESGQPFDEVIRERFPASRVAVLPALRHDELLPVVAGSRFVVLPSKVENLPNACLEAMALGRPVVATTGVSFEEMVTHGVNGTLISQDDDIELARSMVDLWQSPRDHTEAMGEAGRAAVAREFGPGDTIAPLVALLERAARSSRPIRRVRLAGFVKDVLGTIRTEPSATT